MLGNEINNLFDEKDKLLKNINSHRKLWNASLVLVFVLVCSLIAFWDFISENESIFVWTTVGFITLSVLINWWYWSIKVLLVILKFQKNEVNIVGNLLIEVKELRLQLIEISKDEKNNN